jgi:hypothetical protein
MIGAEHHSISGVVCSALTIWAEMSSVEQARNIEVTDRTPRTVPREHAKLEARLPITSHDGTMSSTPASDQCKRRGIYWSDRTFIWLITE